MIGRIDGSEGLDRLAFTAPDRNNENSRTSFARLLRDNIEQVNQLQLEADQVTEDFALGKIDNIHEVTITAQKANIALDLTLAVQNKVVEAYNEIMRMQV